LPFHILFRLARSLFSSGFPITHISRPGPSACYMPTHLTFPNLINFITFCEEYKWRRSSLRSSLCHFFCLRSEHYPQQRPVLKHPQSVILT
jgi:hypothetical protein